MKLVRTSLKLLIPAVLIASSCWAADAARIEQNAAYEATLDRIFTRENQFVESMRQYTPLAETYIQDLKPDNDLGEVPSSDHYFMGRLVVGDTVSQKSFDKRPGFFHRTLAAMTDAYRVEYLPLGFMQLIFLDNRDFSRQTYDLKYLRREFLGQVRCMVFDVVPRQGVRGPHFLGRIWVEDQDLNIVRLNGTYAPQPKFHFYFHFDSWRLNVRPGIWVPAYVYTEEHDRRYNQFRSLTMKGQTRLWGYDLKNAGHTQEFTSVVVDAPRSEIADRTDDGSNEISPVTSTRAWEGQAEQNVLERLERAGVLAPEGEVDKILQTVVNNLEITNNLDIHPDVRCRVLMTTPLETFTIGHTIVVSRGLLDVLPDEASLAMVLAHELAHIALGHRLNPKYAFSDQMLFPDEQAFRRIILARTPEEETAADQKATEFLANSPYKDKLAGAALFLR
ncbi:MAG: M48 family metalloprotease, partial [Acidobacteria bacterium]|nr:M48 family metalloprotease [Acidobacteriota bacterium]